MLYRRAHNLTGRTSGFTLMELILVLAIIALVATITVPAMNVWFQSYRFQEGIDTLRTRWLKARTLAMDEGRPYRFSWEVEGSGYRIAPNDLEHWPELADSPAGPTEVSSSYGPGLVIEDSLPEGVRFAAYEGDFAVSLCFWPDGTARIYAEDGTELANFTILVVDKFNAVRAMRVRALTGGITVLDLNQLSGGF